MEHKHMEHIKHIIDAYEDAQEELMGAQGYANKAYHAQDNESKAMYISMARQELEHENKLLESGDRVIKSMDADAHRELMDFVWMHLKKNLHKWRQSIEIKISPNG
jgi:hypothetical protein